MKKVFITALAAICMSSPVFGAGFLKVAGGGTDSVPNVGDLATDLLIDSYSAKVDSDGNVYVATYPAADQTVGFFRINRSGVVDRVFTDAINLNEYIDDIAMDREGNVYLLYYSNRIIKVDPNDVMTEITNTIKSDCVAVNASGNVYASGYHDPRVWKIDPVMLTTTVIYTDSDPNFSSYACGSDGAGNLYADFGAKLFRISGDGVSTHIAGNGTQGQSGDGTEATLAEIGLGAGVATDHWGNVYIGSHVSNTEGYLRRIDTGGIISTMAQVPHTGAPTSFPSRVSVDNEGMVYVHVYGSTGDSEVQKYVFPPEVHSALPESALAGESITLFGRYFLEDGIGGSVTFGGNQADVTFWSNDTIKVTVPAGLKGNYDVLVTTKDGDISTAYSFHVK